MMLADPDRHRRLWASALLFLIFFVMHGERKGWFDRYYPEAAPANETAARDTAAIPEPPASRPERETDGASQGPEEPTVASLDRAHDAAANFAHAYLTWSPDESHADRVARIANYSTRELAADIADARQLGAADEADRGEEWSQTAEILGTQTLTVRSRHVELVVLAEVTTAGSDATTVTPTNLTVVLREDEGAWLVDDLR
jgi:hypothetical protein